MLSPYNHMGFQFFENHNRKLYAAQITWRKLLQKIAEHEFSEPDNQEW